MNLNYDEALTIKRELKVCARVLNNPEKYSEQTIAMFRKAKDSAEKKHGIYSHPKPFEETCAAYGEVIQFPQPTHRVEV
tara:strand:- start:225 stop:461 length:237 start_codon:yes stop_codon:yes gene_type:complete